MNRADFDPRPVYRYDWHLRRWVFYCSARYVKPCASILYARAPT